MLGGGVPEAAADVDGVRKFKLSHVRVRDPARDSGKLQCYEDVQLGRFEAAQRVNGDDCAQAALKVQHETRVQGPGN